MRNSLAWLAAVIVIAGGVAYWWHFRAEPVPEVPPVASAPPVPEVAAPVATAPAIAHPVPAPAADAPPLPPLADSDRAAAEMLASLFGHEAFARFFVGDDVIRRFVATVDNLPRATAAQRLFPVRPVPGRFATSGTDDAFTLDGDNGLRYRAYVLAMEQVEAKKLAAAYIRHYPLFQAAYQELGYPNAYFNDRLVQAIDDLLATPDVASARLVQPKVLYEFADPALEERSAGQKMLLRMGPANAARVKDAGQPCLREASIAKLFASEMAERVVSAAIQTLGGYGYLEDFPLERIARGRSSFLKASLADHEHALACLTEGSFTIRTLEQARALASFIALLGAQPESLALGLSELLVNGVEHGNLGIDFAEKRRLREADCWEEEVARRLTLEENRHKTVRLRVRGDDSRWVFEIHDDGPGFDWRGFLDFDPERAFAPNGRGIALSRQMSFASLTYLPPGNQVVVTVAKPGAHS